MATKGCLKIIREAERASLNQNKENQKKSL